MTKEQAISILDNHSIEHRFDGSQLQVLDVWTMKFNGKIVNGSDWIICPRTKQQLKEWLGY